MAPQNRAPRALASCQGLHIYGAGKVGKELFGVLQTRGIPVLGFLDAGAGHGESWRGVPIQHPSCVPQAERAAITVVLAIFNRDVAIDPILRSLEAQGYRKTITFLDIFELFGDQLGERFWLTSRNFLLDNAARISLAERVWADPASRDLFRAVLQFRLSGDDSHLPPPDMRNQYFSPEVPGWRTPLRFVDCGAYDGDTLATLLGKVPLEAVAAFECDPVNFAKLGAFLEANRSHLPEPCFAFPSGVWSHATTLSFAADGSEGSHIASGAGQTISCVALDQAIPFFRPNLIKMDMEGAEVEALWGARKLILANRPGLAICLYHRPEHLWTIPLMLEQWGCEYDFFLKAHGHQALELVLYAVGRA